MFSLRHRVFSFSFSNPDLKIVTGTKATIQSFFSQIFMIQYYLLPSTCSFQVWSITSSCEYLNEAVKVGQGIEQVFRGKKLFRQISPLFHPLLPFVRLFSRLSCDTAIKQRRVGAFHRVTGSDRFLLNTNTDTNYQHRYKCSNNTNVDTNIDTNTVTKTNIDTHTYTNTNTL